MFGGKLKSWVESHLPRPLRRKQKSKHKRDELDYEDRSDRHRLTSRSNVELIFRLHQNNPIYSAGNEDIYGRSRGETKSATGGFLSSPESAYSTGYSTEGLSPASVGSVGPMNRFHQKLQGKCSVQQESCKVVATHLSPSVFSTPGLYRRTPGASVCRPTGTNTCSPRVGSNACPASCSPRPRTAIRTNPWVPSPNRNSYESNTTDSSGIGVSSVPSSLKSRTSAPGSRYPNRAAVQRGSTKCEIKYSDSLTDSPCSTISIDRETDILSDYESQETKDSTEDESLLRNGKPKVYSYAKQDGKDEAEKRYEELIKETQSILTFLQDEQARTPLRKPRTEPPARRFLCQKMSISSSSEDEKLPLDTPPVGESVNNHCKFKYSPPASFWSITESGRDPPVRPKRQIKVANCGPRRGVDSCPNTPQLNRNVPNYRKGCGIVDHGVVDSCPNTPQLNRNLSYGCGRTVDSCPNTPQLDKVNSYARGCGIVAEERVVDSCPNTPQWNRNSYERSVLKCGRYVAVVGQKTVTSCPASPYVKSASDSRCDNWSLNGNPDEYDVLAKTRKMLEDEMLALRRQQLLTTLEELKQSLEEQSARIQEAFKTSQELEESFTLR